MNENFNAHSESKGAWDWLFFDLNWECCMSIGLHLKMKKKNQKRNKYYENHNIRLAFDD